MNTGIIESKDYIPWVLRQSRDVRAYCKLIDLLINDFKTDTDNWINLLDFNSCPDKLLPLLASYVGYKYDYSESYDSNRLIIKHYPEMIRNRGSEIGLSLATALSVNMLNAIDSIEALSMFRIEYVKSDTRIDIYIFFPSNLSKIRDLIEVVRPAGCGLQLIPAELIQTIDGIEIHSYGYGTKYGFDRTRYTVGNQTRIGFSEITNENEISKKNPEGN